MKVCISKQQTPIYQTQFIGAIEIFKCMSDDCIYNNNYSCKLYEDEQKEKYNFRYQYPYLIMKKKRLEYTVCHDDNGNMLSFDCHSYIKNNMKE